jgi:hypothetical protein
MTRFVLICIFLIPVLNTIFINQAIEVYTTPKNYVEILKNFTQNSTYNIVNETSLIDIMPKCLNVECESPNCYWFITNFNGQKCLQCACH